MNKNNLSLKEVKMVGELDKIYSLLRLDYQNFADLSISSREAYFYAAKDQVIRGKVMHEFTAINLAIDLCILTLFFSKRKVVYLAGTKRFKIFNKFIL